MLVANWQFFSFAGPFFAHAERTVLQRYEPLALRAQEVGRRDWRRRSEEADAAAVARELQR